MNATRSNTCVGIDATTETETTHDLAAPTRDCWRLVAVAGAAIFVAQLDTTISNVALPAIATDLGVSTAVISPVTVAVPACIKSQRVP